MSDSPAKQLLSLVKNATIVDLSVTTGENQPSSPPEGQRFGQFMMNHYTWPRRQFLEYVQLHDDHTGAHIDAPSHMTPTLASGLPHATEHGTVTVEQLRLSDMIGEAECQLVASGPVSASPSPTTQPTIRSGLSKAAPKACESA